MSYYWKCKTVWVCSAAFAFVFLKHLSLFSVKSTRGHVTRSRRNHLTPWNCRRRLVKVTISCLTVKLRLMVVTQTVLVKCCLCVLCIAAVNIFRYPVHCSYCYLSKHNIVSVRLQLITKNEPFCIWLALLITDYVSIIQTVTWVVISLYCHLVAFWKITDLFSFVLNRFTQWGSSQ